MSITIGSNIASLQAQRHFHKNSTLVGTAFERLSSGQRINHASDDAAGLAVADNLQARSRVFTQGVRNINDGISLLNIADGAVTQLTDITTRLTELAEQAANGVFGVSQRKSLDEEGQALKEEYLRIIQSTEFNNQRVLTSDFGKLRVQAGYGINGGIESGLGGKVGTGTFQDAVSLQVAISDSGLPATVYGMTLGDLNGDGLEDLVTVGQSYTSATGMFLGQANIRLGTGDGTFTGSTDLIAEQGVPAADSQDVTLGDLNGDGILDLVTAGQTFGGSSYGLATVRIGAGDGTFGSATSYITQQGSSSGRSYSVTLGDLNNDGVLDLVTAGSIDNGSGEIGNVSIRLGTGDGTFGSTLSYTMEQGSSNAASNSVSLADLNNDGVLDLVTAGYAQSGSIQGYATIRLGMGDGTFGNTTSYSTEQGGSSGTSYAVSLADLNNDGFLDLATAGFANSGANQGYATIRLGAGDGTFGSATSFTTEQGGTNAISYDLALADINGDGFTDLVTAGQVNDGNQQGSGTIRLGAGDGTFDSPASFVTEQGGTNAFSRAVALADLNRDGVVDVVTAGDSNASGTTYGYTNTLLSVTTDGTSPLLEFSLGSIAEAKDSLSQFKQKLAQLATQRGQIGVFESRLRTASNVLEVSTENIIAAESRIRDTDVASESLQLTRLTILQQASSAILAQANTQPALALQLLS